MDHMSSSPNHPPLKLAVIGVGALGRHHARLLGEMADVELVAVADPNEAQGRQVAEACRTAWVADYRELLAARKVDAVSIVVPTALHRRVAEEFLTRDIPVLVEKPIAPKVADGAALAALAEERGTVLQVGHIERFNPAFRALQMHAGSPRYLRAERFSPYSFRSTDISVVHDMMIHDIDLALCLTQSRVVGVEAFGICVCGGFADVVQARLRFANGCVADLAACRVAPGVQRTLQAWSEHGCWTADLQEQTLSGFAAGPDLAQGEFPQALATQPGVDVAALKAQFAERFVTQERPAVLKSNALQDELRSFLHAVRTQTSPPVDGHAGVAALQVAEQVMSAVDRHCWDGGAQGRVGPYANPLFAHRAAA
jgi:predicted dehydrogenase